MSKPKTAKREGVVLLIVLGTLLVVIVLAGFILNIISNQSRLSNHQISRIKAYYASKGMMNYALEMLREGTWVADSTVNVTACHGDCAGFGVPSPTYSIPTDVDIPYNVLVIIYPLNSAENTDLDGNVTQINIKADYTFTV
jgi:Tfp pilus assembly protein PilX